MSIAHVITRLSALSVAATGVLLSIATSPIPDPSVQRSTEGPALTLAQPSEERRFEIVVEATAPVLSRESYARALNVHGLVSTELPDLSDAPDAGDAGDAGDAEVEGAPAPQDLSPEEAAEHPTALSLELTHVSGDGEGGALSSHLVVDRAETNISVELPLELVCAGATCSARYEVSWRGPRDTDQTGPVDIVWSANAWVLYVVEDEDGEEDYSVPEGAELSIEIRPLDQDGETPNE